MLKDIRKHIEEGTMSLIIGAGFSKNISDKFPLWTELIGPMVEELYLDYEKDNEETKEHSIQRIINQKGYLDIASEYVKRNGCHEAIDLYIEKHTPYLEKLEEGKYNLILNGDVVDSDPSLECHRKLLDLGSKHIFTFNYDNTLDVLADVTNTESIYAEQAEAEKKLAVYRKFEKKYKELLLEIEDNTIQNKHEVQDNVKAPFSEMTRKIKALNYEMKNNNIIKALYLTEFSEVIKDNEETHEKNIDVLDTAIEREQNKVNICREKRVALYQLITDSHKISLSDNCRNIYKLHGNLRPNSEGDYGFDGDRYKQYVITAEDYLNYPVKHEAFVSLMKISLLKGSFCLMGFSADDPNFITWISWVKDILDKGPSRSQTKRSIYFINSAEEPLDEVRQLLLDNNYINIVNLFDYYPDATSHKERISMFLDDVKQDIKKYNEYEKIWREMEIPQKTEDFSGKLSSNIEDLYKLSEYNRIAKQFGMLSHKRTNVFSKADKLTQMNSHGNLCSKLIYSAIKGELLPWDTVLITEQFELLSKQGDDLKRLFSILDMRNSNFMGRPINRNESNTEDHIYEYILNQLIFLRFNEALIEINKWKPKDGFNKSRKYLLRSLFGKFDEDGERLIQLINRDNFKSLQDYKFSLDSLYAVVGFNKNYHLREPMEYITKHNPRLINIWDLTDDIIAYINKRDFKIAAYDNKSTMTFTSTDYSFVYSIKLLYIFLEVGIPTKAGIAVAFSEEKWLVICEKLYEEYPYPCLYFSLLYGNKKDLLQRIAQNYIYSAKLYDQIPSLLCNMLNALLDDDCPRNVRDAIYIVAPIFMKAVPVKEWEADFIRVYNTINIEELTEVYTNNYDSFLIEGVAHIKNKHFKHKVLLSCLKVQSGINDLHNSLIIASKEGLKLGKRTLKELDSLLENATKPTHFYVLLNLSDHIDNDILSERFLSLSDDLYNDYTLLNGVARFGKGNKELQKKLKHIILNSPLLWQTCTSDDLSSVSLSGYTLNISELQKWINFSKIEILQIFENMCQAFEIVRIVEERRKGRGIWEALGGMNFILKEMKKFMIINENVLQRKKCYGTVKDSVNTLLKKRSKGNAITALLSDDTKTGKVIEWLVDEISNKGVTKFQQEYILLTNKMISQNSKYLNSCFVHFAWALETYHGEYNKEIFKPILEHILISYKSYFQFENERKWDIEYARKEIVEQKLLSIYSVLKKWGGYSDFWDKYKTRYH